jgi:hypothetical protein
MKYKAKVSFSGLCSMSKGEVKEINDKYIVDDLLRAGYIEPIEKPKAKKPLKKGE